VRKPYPFFLAPRAQKEPKTPKSFARCDERRGLRALDLRDLFEKRSIKNFRKLVIRMMRLSLLTVFLFHAIINMKYYANFAKG
jgi:hypothetical protein